MSAIIQGVVWVFYALGAVWIFGNWLVVGRGARSWLLEGKARRESLRPLVGFVFVLVGTLAAWNQGWLWWVGVALLALDLPFTLFVAIGVPIAIWRSPPRDS
jgi:hypothetical protein